MQYGEGEAAFVRLQKEILRNSNDQTLFAWSPSSRCINDILESHQQMKKNGSRPQRMYYGDRSTYGIFASHPSDFEGCQNIVFAHMYASSVQMTEMNGAIYTKLPLISLGHVAGFKEHLRIGLLPCTTTDNPDYMIGIVLAPWSSDTRFRRVSVPGSNFTVLVSCQLALKATLEEIWVDDESHINTALKHHYHRTVTQRRTVILNDGVPSASLRLVATDPPLEMDSAGMEFRVAEVNETGTDVMRLGFEYVPKDVSKNNYFFNVLLALGTTVDTHNALKDRAIVFVYPMEREIQESEMIPARKQLSFDSDPADADSGAELTLHDTDIEVSTTSRVIFNHLITRLTIRGHRLFFQEDGCVIEERFGSDRLPETRMRRTQV
jgi:hypothetical protein